MLTMPSLMAWARISPKDNTIIEFALKASLLGDAKTFAWWAWTGLMKLSPADFEIVDRLQDNESWDLDNSCSWIYGLTPEEGQVANLCAIVKPTPTPTNPPPQATQATSCPVQSCPIFQYWDSKSCSCRIIIIIIPTATPYILY